ncbi:hypothetical protein N7414_10810 [Pseudomonas sp. GD04087]|uniref:hypothetical protein n=1 Tax=Pseudomonas TaxID=286 RepID=UPI001F3ED95F|nr:MULTISPECIES: hypothetical protein [Pseudomonas]MCP1649486.1 hypothetical protein [Pseudomonas nitroreducens]MCP1687786.1 hypothetical protein [Pseudomonas nitroreducens]MDH0289603.1 hypothetical protein [Pseudomonas sp. GD04087]MDH1048895.1 hypothetical protein [Pseudomonas sp. GD03903]MDH1999495.1 hypothetical protein [Pseudomonas sp. GD03691]
MKVIPLLAATCIVACLPVRAESVFKPIELKDQELAQLRGKYVMPGRVISFGIVMSSTWKNAVGDNIGAKVSMQIQESTIKPQFYVTTIDEKGTAAAPAAGTGTVTGGAGLNQTQGVTQSVRAAGDYNTAANNVSIDVKEADQAPAVAQQGTPLNSTPITASNGAGTVSVSPGSGGIQLAINANGQGSSMQQLAAGGLLQAAQMVGGNNAVNNLAQLSVVLKNNLPSSGALDCNLDQLKGLRTMGM